MLLMNPSSRTWRLIAGPIASAFVDAVNASDANRLANLFIEDAYLNDQLRDFWGKEAIARWIRDEIVAERFYMNVTDARQHFGDLMLRAEVGGDFEKMGLPSPLILSFIFTFFDDKIARLLILLNRPDEAEPEIRIGTE
ncbi:nuclear transport factor 2 family protein [Paraburkholderia pallida]|uniref:Nuclear transport factor 2 family protein n=1 Tax=Paraburkholderia pallida TaxID=2547399 RepID=A0A4P7D3N2_9BURK|nr:nuclear transport factor 2 family protein [Paraburkholderia pallida]QBR01400.1 nuclear transport factor 2 family protein [Paraburkholderia pallida]